MTIEKVYGQEHVWTYFHNAIIHNSVAHAYLFSGKKGLGKKIAAKQFAQLLLCEKNSLSLSCTCSACYKVASDIHPDVHWVGLDDEIRYLKISDVRELQEKIILRPLEAERKIVVVNQAERLTEEAANAFLKTLEEPPEHTHIILLTDERSYLLDTILSRVVEIRFNPIAVEQLTDILHQDYAITAQARWLAHQSQGSVGVALEYYQQNYYEEKNAVIDAFIKQEQASFFLDLMKLSSQELDKLLHILASFLHDVLLMKVGIRKDMLIHHDRPQDSEAIAKIYTLDGIIAMLEMLENTRYALRKNANAKLLLMRLASAKL